MVTRIKKLWYDEQNLQGAAGLLVFTMLLSNVLGFLRDVILANTIPLKTLDTYYAAFRIPDFLFNLFILGAISSAFIPVFLDLKAKQGESAAWKMAHNLIHVSLAVLFVLGLIMVIFMPHILPAFVPGFDPARFQQTVLLARILLLSPFLFAVSYIVGGVLNAYKKFFAYSLAPLLYNGAIIVGGFLSPRFGVTGVAWAVVIGACLHVLIQLPVLKSLNYRYYPVFNIFDKDLIQVIRLMIPRSISLGMAQIVLVFFTRIGSELPAGSVSIFSLTNNFQTTPVAVFAASIATAVFPMLGAAISEKRNKEFKDLFTDSMKGMLFYMIPSMILFWVFRAHLIRLYLALNHQTWQDTIRAITTFQWFILALVPQGFNLIIIRAYYALKDTRRPMYLSIIAGAVSVGLAWYLARIVGDVPALSLAFFLGTTFESLLLFAVFEWLYRPFLDLKRVGETLLVATVLALISGLFARFLLHLISDGALIPTNGLGTTHISTLFTALLVASIGAIVVYIGGAFVLKREELKWLWPKRASRNVILPETESVAADEGLQ